MVFRYSKDHGTAMSCQLTPSSPLVRPEEKPVEPVGLKENFGRTLVPTRCARGTLSSTESAAYMLQQAKPTGEAGNPRGGVAVLARSSLSPSETGPPSHKQAGKDGGEKPEKNNSRIKAFKSVGCMSVCVCQ